LSSHLFKKGFKMTKNEVIRKFGGARALAEALGISTQAVGQWGQEVPPLRQYQIRELLTSGMMPIKGKRDGKRVQS
jgi:transcriptional repressor of cell division inhibition gene dicB